jgi:hypothetical protein
MKKSQISVAIKEMQIKTTLRFPLTPLRRLQSRMQTTNAGKNWVKEATLFAVGGKVN